MKSKVLVERIGIGLMLVAITLLLVNVYQSGAGTKNRIVEIGSWMALLIAFVYMFWLSREKKKIKSNSPDTN